MVALLIYANGSKPLPLSFPELEEIRQKVAQAAN